MRLIYSLLAMIVIINVLLIIWAISDKLYNKWEIENKPEFKKYSEYLLDARDQCDSFTWLANSIF